MCNISLSVHATYSYFGGEAIRQLSYCTRPVRSHILERYCASVLVGGGSGTRGELAWNQLFVQRREAGSQIWLAHSLCPAGCFYAPRTNYCSTVRACVCLALWRHLCMANLSIRAPVLVEVEDAVLALMMLCSAVAVALAHKEQLTNNNNNAL